MSTKKSKKSENSWVGWVVTAILFATGLWPFALISLFINLKNLSGSTRTRHPYDLQQEQQTQTQTKSAGSRKKATRRKSKKSVTSNGLIAGGAALSAISGIGTMGFVTEFVESLFMGYFFADELMPVLTCLVFLVAGLVMLLKGVDGKRQQARFSGYLAYIGTNQEVGLAHMAAAFDVPMRRLCRDLREMLADGILPRGYLDLAAGKLVLSETGYRAPEPEPIKPEAAPSETETPQDDNAILREIKLVNDAIPDPVMSAKIDRIGEITGKILDYQRKNPGKDSQLRSFLNYYLPTTLKILRAYAQLDAQGVDGENISAAKERIEGMMDKVVDGFENQLDKLFRDDAMDISSDVAVLEQMLEKDGLSGQGQGMTLGV